MAHKEYAQTKTKEAIVIWLENDEDEKGLYMQDTFGCARDDKVSCIREKGLELKYLFGSPQMIYVIKVIIIWTQKLINQIRIIQEDWLVQDVQN